jgi:hypothetical protein
MCWNAEVSLNTFLFGMISMTIVLLLNKISFITILLALTLSLIQLMEYYAWNNINNKDAIFKLSIIGYFIIVSQILILNYGFLNNNDRLISVIIILVLSIYFFIYNYQNDKFYMEKGKNKHLIWHWIDIPTPLLLIVLIFYIYPAIQYGIITSMAIIVPLLISLYYYYKYKTWGSMWCYMSNFFWILLILKSLILKSLILTKK